MTKILISNSYAETVMVGEEMAKQLKNGDKLLLSGDLGAGKTALTQGIAIGLGVHELVTSPTFTLLNTYRGKDIDLFHFDMYRLDNESEIIELGLEDYLYYDGICVIEWNKFTTFTGRIFDILLERLDDNVRRITIDERTNN